MRSSINTDASSIRNNALRDSIRQVRQHIGVLRTALLAESPEPIEECLPRLVEAAGSLGLIERQLRTERTADAGSVHELNALQSDLRAVGKLIENGAKFYQGLANLLSAATKNYTSGGQISPLSASGTISIRG
jgi:hypothetical protein